MRREQAVSGTSDKKCATTTAGPTRKRVSADAPRKGRRQKGLVAGCVGAFLPVCILTLSFLFDNLPPLSDTTAGSIANSTEAKVTVGNTTQRSRAQIALENSTVRIKVTPQSPIVQILPPRSPAIKSGPTSGSVGSTGAASIAGSNPSDNTEAKLRYLSLVYNEEVTDPSLFDELEVIYRNTSASLPLHMIPCSPHGVFPYGHDCAKFWKRKCGNGRWLESSQDLTLLAEVNWPSRKNIVGDNKWLEVTRWGMSEGNGYGCFFNVRRGTGVFVNTKKTIVVQNDTHAKNTFNMPLNTSWAAYCPYARPQGYDTIQIVNAFDGSSNQLIYCTGTCATEPVIKACVQGVEFRTGVNHDKPCECDDDISVINCGSAIAPKGKQHICDQKWTEVNGAEVVVAKALGGKIASGKLGLG